MAARSLAGCGYYQCPGWEVHKSEKTFARSIRE